MPETKHLLDVLRQIENTAPLLARADEVLLRFQSEPLMAGVYATPQSGEHHAEGPTVRSHLRLFLASLFAITDGTVKLLEIEEFARMKGYEEEIQEMQQMLMENPTTFEVFALIHDVGKPFCLTQDPDGMVHYHGHAKEIYRPEIRSLLYRLAEAYKLPDRDVEMIIPLVSYHLVPLYRFKKAANAKDVEVISKFATEQGEDPDDFIDMLQAAILLDQVMGSRQIVGGKMTVSATHLTNFFIAERAYAPWKLAAKEKARNEARKRIAQKTFREAGLDGAGIMALTGIKSGRELGDLLKKLHAVVLDGGELPKSVDSWKDELVRRIGAAKAKFGELV